MPPEDIVDGALTFLLWIADRKAPTAEEEIEFLQARRTRSAQEADAALNQEAARWVQETMALKSAGSADRRFAEQLLTEGGVGARQKSFLTAAGVETALARAEAAGRPAGGFFHFVKQLQLYRHELADRLAAVHRAGGMDPLLLAPATVDYDRWLGQDVTRSPLPRQIDVMEQVSARPDGPPVHGYVAFDPLREALYRRDPAKERFNPLGEVRRALECGFIGVKLYPPMGFRASGNAPGATYPNPVLELMNHVVSEPLNQALAALYDTCVELKAPIMAHGLASNATSKAYAARADPGYWIPVFRQRPELHVALAHYGAFRGVSKDWPASTKPGTLEATWEWAFGAYVKENPRAPVFIDLSYLSEVWDWRERRRIRGALERYIREFDSECEHLLFGSDWVMLSQERGYEGYAGDMVAFLESAGVTGARLDRVLAGNAVRFMRLGEGQPGRERLLAFYRKHGLPASRLRVA
jgi:predicted TIM-barrel fold metal-dependent hydrolase